MVLGLVVGGHGRGCRHRRGPAGTGLQWGSGSASWSYSSYEARQPVTSHTGDGYGATDRGRAVCTPDGTSRGIEVRVTSQGRYHEPTHLRWWYSHEHTMSSNTCCTPYDYLATGRSTRGWGSATSSASNPRAPAPAITWPPASSPPTRRSTTTASASHRRSRMTWRWWSWPARRASPCSSWCTRTRTRVREEGHMQGCGQLILPHPCVQRALRLRFACLLAFGGILLMTRLPTSPSLL